jgi:HEAT repeat protein
MIMEEIEVLISPQVVCEGTEGIMDFTSTEEALAVLNDPQIAEVERTQAAHYLGKHPDEQVMASLVERLEDDDAGVRWAAANALAGLGQSALAPLLHILAQRPAGSLLRSGALYVITHSGSYAVRQWADQLRPALEGPAGGHSAMRVAQEILKELQK